MKYTIMPAESADAEEILAIYAPYVTDTAVSFEHVAPSVEEFRKRIETISAKYPYLKAVDENGKICGYAYATAFKPRAAYDWSVESTIYLQKESQGAGLGRALYCKLEEILRSIGILNMNACIAMPRSEADEHLTMGSPLFHEKMGFALVGTFHMSGYKFNTWYDMIWMEKMLGEHQIEQPKVRFGQWRELM